ncbi:MAG: DUF559 domain-containing protein, partial [Polyangiaceae bacterium]|nr:DUF559 domain-containing protein [Polyangiaceae bacterium]
MHAFSRPSCFHRQLLASRARAMRHAPTASERLLWAALAGRKMGTVFRRQVVVVGVWCASSETTRTDREALRTGQNAFQPSG